jgi:hypothetical protein
LSSTPDRTSGVFDFANSLTHQLRLHYTHKHRLLPAYSLTTPGSF